MKKSYLFISLLIIGTVAGCNQIAPSVSSSSSESASLSSAEPSSSNKPSSSSSSTSIVQSSSSSSSTTSIVVNGYYKNIDLTKTGSELKTALHKLISNFTDIGYNALWDAFRDTDAKDNGKVWDMYSNCNYTFGTDQNKGNSGPEGTNYNREHSIPNSWFGGKVSPMYSDLFHLYPTDSHVNGKRSNYPYGEVGTASYTSGNGSKLGSSSFSGYSGTVFEPIDEYKGDFARTYFYFATCYQNKNITESSEAKIVFKSESYPTLTTYAKNLFMKWSKEDPVSEKEIDRNNAVYSYQKNRNPFIDIPGLEDKIWG